MKCMVVLSGGLDSATLLYDMKDKHSHVEAITVNYGQRHMYETVRAADLCNEIQVPWTCLDMTVLGAVLGGSSLTDNEIETPKGHYADETMKKTVVPNRNMILLSICAGVAISKGYDALAYGAHGGDHAVYPDCRPAFVAAMRNVFGLCHYEPLTLEVPYLHMLKADILAVGLDLNVPFDNTWTCYEGPTGITDIGDDTKHACGQCGSCVERIEAFKKNRKIDPIPYLAEAGVTWEGCTK